MHPRKSLSLTSLCLKVSYSIRSVVRYVPRRDFRHRPHPKCRRLPRRRSQNQISNRPPCSDMQHPAQPPRWSRLRVLFRRPSPLRFPGGCIHQRLTISRRRCDHQTFCCQRSRTRAHGRRIGRLRSRASRDLSLSFHAGPTRRCPMGLYDEVRTSISIMKDHIKLKLTSICQ